MHAHLSSTRELILSLESAIGEDIIGQHDLIRKLIITLLAGGHALIEGVPGLGKTKTVKTLARVLGYDSKRISFTPDLLPTDLTGTEIYRPQTSKFETRKGPIFTNILLADEINRTPPKVQSALLEAMEEGHVTIANDTLPLPSPFFVIATQNPLEHEGTYPLPEAELDRFFMKIVLTYPSPEDEKKIWLTSTQREEKSKSNPIIISPAELIEIRDYLREHILVDEKIHDYVSDILEMTRSRDGGRPLTQTQNHLTQKLSDTKEQKNISNSLSYGASTRAGMALISGGRIVALMDGRDYTTPDDIKYIAHDILRHRIGLSYEAISEHITTDSIISEILSTVRIP